MRIFSYAFHLLLGLVMMAIGFVAWASSQNTLQIGFLPWEGAALTYWLLFSGVAGVLITLLAIKGVLRPLFLLWSLAVAVMLVRGLFFSSFHFGLDADTFWAGLGRLVISGPVLLLLAALLALAGSLTLLRRRAEPLHRRTAIA